MHLNRFWVAGVALALTLAVGGVALTGEQTKPNQKGKGQKLDPFGEPKEFHKGALTGFAVWHGKKGGWHLRTTTNKAKHHFKGHIQVEGGVFESVASHDLEHKGKLADHWKVSSDKITFDFKTDQGIDGIDFKVSKDAKVLRFQLHFDGKDQREHIFIGHEGHHPNSDPFTLPAHGHGKKK